MKIKKFGLILVIVVLTAAVLFGCNRVTSDNYKDYYFQYNEIVSYEPLDTNKMVISIGNLINANTAPLVEALKKRYPNVNFVSSVGGGAYYLKQQGENNDMSDIVFYAFEPLLTDYFYELSAESFTSRYNQTSLDALEVEGKLYQLPIASSCYGIFYNKDLFEEKGWSIPKTRTDFYALCETIEAAGIRAYAPCLKYISTLAEVGLGESNREIFGSVDSTSNFYDFIEGEHSSVGVMEPFLEGLRNLKERGIIKDEDFTSSATQIRQSMYAGETAMVPYALNLTTFYDDEKAKAEAEGDTLCEIGFMGFPTDNENERYLSFLHDSTCMGLSRTAMQDSKKKAILLDIFDYFSTNEGQEVLFKCFTGVSSLKSYQTTITSRFQEVVDCMANGRMYFPHAFWDIEDMTEFKKWYNGDSTDEQMLEVMDDIITRRNSGGIVNVAFGTATDTFTRLETTMFMADCFRETTGADIGLMPDNTLFSGNLMKIYKGDINRSDVFYLRGVSNNEYLSVYDITGANLKALLEHPYISAISGVELNAMYGFSGLKITYAPWRDMSENILSVTLADGTPIEDDKVYKVAAWDKSIDERYLCKDTDGKVICQKTEFNNCESYFKTVITQKGTISPVTYRDARLTIDWTY